MTENNCARRRERENREGIISVAQKQAKPGSHAVAATLEKRRQTVCACLAVFRSLHRGRFGDSSSDPTSWLVEPAWFTPDFQPTPATIHFDSATWAARPFLRYHPCPTSPIDLPPARLSIRQHSQSTSHLVALTRPSIVSLPLSATSLLPASCNLSHTQFASANEREFAFLFVWLLLTAVASLCQCSAHSRQ